MFISDDEAVAGIVDQFVIQIMYTEVVSDDDDDSVGTESVNIAVHILATR